jgi:outer membrane receptor for ferrienterochelin and colicin
LFARIGAAQEKPAEQPVEDISVTAERDDPRQYANASKFTVSNKELTKFGDTSLIDAIKRVPGIAVKGTDVRFRGLGSDYTQILINGDPAPNGFTLDSIPVDTVERIEIYKTPLAELSTQSIAGTINIVLKEKAKDRHLSAKSKVAYDQGNKSPSLTIEGSETVGHFSFQLTGTASKDSQTFDSHIDEFDYDATDDLITKRAISEASDQRLVTYNLTPVIIWKGPSDAINWQLFAQQFQFPFLYDLNEDTTVGSPSDYPYSRWESRGPTRDLYRSNLTWTHTLSQNRALESKLNISYLDRHVNLYFDGFDPMGIFALDRNIASASIDRTLTSKEKYTEQLNDSQLIAVGWDGSITQRTDNELQTDRTPPQEQITYFLDQFYDARIVKKALYAQDDCTLSGSLSMYLGARFEMTNVRVTGPDFGSASNNTAIVSPIAQLIWKMPYNSKDQLRVNIAHTTRAPTTYELVPRRYLTNTDNGPANPDSQGNPYLKPERAWGLDVGYESYHQDDGLITVSAYARHVSEVMLPILFTDGTEWVTSTTNSGTATAYGTEAEFKWPLQKLLSWSSKLSIKGDVSSNWSSVRNVPGPDNRLADQTPLTSDLGLEYEGSRGLSAGASFRYTPGYTARATVTLINYYGMTQALDIYGLWAINSTSRLRLSFENMFHRNQVAGSVYADSTGASSRFTIGDPGDRVNLSFEFGI